MEAVTMNFAIRELEYLLECLNFHYAEHSDEKHEYIELNAELCGKLDNIRQVCTCKENKV